MSVESPEALERSVLESKDREQLLAIASALGVKANSRTKKGEIVDRILEQVRGDADTADAGGSAPTNGHGRDANGSGDGRGDRDQPTCRRRCGRRRRAGRGPGGRGRRRLRPTRPSTTAAEPASAAVSVEVLPADPFEEPPAEWELALGDDAAAATEPPGCRRARHRLARLRRHGHGRRRPRPTARARASRAARTARAAAAAAAAATAIATGATAPRASTASRRAARRPARRRQPS